MQTKEQRIRRSMDLVTLAVGAVLTVSLAYLGHDPEWFVPLVLLLVGGGLAINYRLDRISTNLRAAAVAIAAGGVVGMMYLLSLGAAIDYLGYRPLVRSLPLPIGFSLLYLLGWVGGVYLGWWADKKRSTRAINWP